MGIATVIEDFSVPAKPMAPTPTPHRAGVLHMDANGVPLNPKTMPPPALPDPEQAPDEHVLKSTRATRVFEVQPTVEDDEDIAQSTSHNDDELPEIKKLEANYKRKISEQGAELGALRQQVNDILAATSKKPDPQSVHPALATPNIEELQREIDAVGKKFLDDPEGSAKKIMELSMKAAQASIVPILRQSEEKSMIEATKSLVKQYPGLVNNKAEAAYVDTAAELLAQEDGYDSPTLDHMQKAMEAYAKRIGWTRPTSGAQPNAEVERMKQEAGSVAPVGASSPGKSKGKIWRKSELDALLTRQPDKYRELQPEIMRAYKEGRVK